ncbi:MAG: TetR/AcrR family transcriptional regulator [Leptolyngbya sp. SIO4C1]|nr:TetR/AcrR family transcriptional regulator [Leptolyngbya sp. SIO4C1]
MPRGGEKTKAHILDVAHRLVMRHSFAGTSIDRILAESNVTKGAFFYHFKSKAELAQALVERYAANDAAHLAQQLHRAEKLSRDPLQQILIFLGLLQEEIAQSADLAGGCLIASFIYQFADLEIEVREIAAQAFLRWRMQLGAKFATAIAQHPPQLPVTAEALADAAVSAFEGGFVMMRVLQDPQQVSQQLTHYRNYIELLFAPPAAPPDR